LVVAKEQIHLRQDTSAQAKVSAAQADERDTVKRSAEILHEFRSMPERQVPRAVLRDARGLAIMRVVKIGFVFSGEGVVIARTGNGWSGPSFIGTGGAGWGLQIGAQFTDFVFVLNNRDAGKGLFAGVSLEGAVIVTEKGKNERYYGRSVTASQILSGKAAAPAGSAVLRKAAGP
jgi:lipid-binding SYLF domain-containing protein